MLWIHSKNHKKDFILLFPRITRESVSKSEPTMHVLYMKLPFINQNEVRFGYKLEEMI